MTLPDYRAGVDERADPASGSVGNWLGWAIYLGMSWTWCIGMFLPVLLVRDYGVWGWIVFAVPNVIGAAAMGWVLARRGASEELVEKHLGACAWFSIVTVAFHIFFTAWMIRRIGGWQASLFTVCAMALVAAVSAQWKQGRLFAGAVIFAVSLILCGYVISTGAAGDVGWSDLLSGHLGDALWLIPVCIFGFALCPYLDLTFHRAVQATAPCGSSRRAFGVGLGVFFLAMILFTLVYSPILIPLIGTVIKPPVVAIVVAAHMVVQTGFTIAQHMAETGPRRQLPGLPKFARELAYVTIIWLIVGSDFPQFRFRGLDGGELVYRLLMSFYGLVFPAYVWLCMLPTWRSPEKPTGRSLTVFGLAILLVGPFYWLGFIDGKMFWLLPGLLIVLLARLAIGNRRTAVDTA